MNDMCLFRGKRLDNGEWIEKICRAEECDIARLFEEYSVIYLEKLKARYENALQIEKLYEKKLMRYDNLHIAVLGGCTGDNCG